MLLFCKIIKVQNLLKKYKIFKKISKKFQENFKKIYWMNFINDSENFEKFKYTVL